MSRPPASLPHPRAAAAQVTLHARTRALEHAAAYAVEAPSAHSTQPWRMDIHPARMDIRADRSRQLVALDPKGRELVESVGAALFNVRVALALDGWGSTIERLPRRDDPDLLAEVRPVVGAPDPVLAALAPSVTRRPTNRRRFTGAHVPSAVLRRLTAIAETEGVLLIPIVDEAHRRLVARLTQRADSLQGTDPGCPAELRHWTDRGPANGDATHSDTEQTMVLLATHTDDELAWLGVGEALQHLFLELLRLGWVARPLPQAIEVPLTRTQLRAALTWSAHPQMLLRIFHAAPEPRTPRRRRTDDVPAAEPPAGPPINGTSEATASSDHRPVPDARRGTTWI